MFEEPEDEKEGHIVRPQHHRRQQKNYTHSRNPTQRSNTPLQEAEEVEESHKALKEVRKGVNREEDNEVHLVTSSKFCRAAGARESTIAKNK